MSTHKSIDRVCIIITIIAVLVTAIFMNGEKIGQRAQDQSWEEGRNAVHDSCSSSLKGIGIPLLSDDLM